eukprot:12406-Pelagococcus_subviridis.AAC.1
MGAPLWRRRPVLGPIGPCMVTFESGQRPRFGPRLASGSFFRSSRATRGLPGAWREGWRGDDLRS